MNRSTVMAMTVDLSKAFNRLDHRKLITICFDTGIPICAIRLLCSYLSGRKMRVHHYGVVSSLYELWRGGPQGGLLTVLWFCLNSNWLTDLCQPGLPATNRFLAGNLPSSVPRSAIEQARDCPPAYLAPYQHLGVHSCPYYLPCQHAAAHDWPEESPENVEEGESRQGACEADTDLATDSAECAVTSSVVVTVLAIVEGTAAQRNPANCVETTITARQHCNPLLDCDGLCHFDVGGLTRHVTYPTQIPGQSIPQCKDNAIRLLDVDDPTCAERLSLDKVCVPLLSTLGPFGKLQSCQLGIPGVG